MSERPKARGNHFCPLPSAFSLSFAPAHGDDGVLLFGDEQAHRAGYELEGGRAGKVTKQKRPAPLHSRIDDQIANATLLLHREQNAMDLFVFDVQGDGFGRLRRRDRAEDQDCEERRAAESHVRENTPPYGRHPWPVYVLRRPKALANPPLPSACCPLPSVRTVRRSWRSPARLRCRPWRGRIASAAAAVRRGLSAAGVCPRRLAGVRGQWPRRLHSASPDRPPTPSR